MKPEKTLIYYFAFPHYRERILKELELRAEGSVVLASGISGRESIKPVTRADIDSLVELPTTKVGPVTWHSGILRRAISTEFEVVVLGPATLSLTTWAILIGRRLQGRRTYLWGRCGRRGERNLKRYLQEAMNRLASGLLVYGEMEKASATELGLNPDRVCIVYNATRDNDAYLGPDHGHAAYSRMKAWVQRARTDGEIVLLNVGRILPSKNLELLLDAARTTRKRFANLKVVIIGGGPHLEVLQKEYPDSFIEYRGWVYDEKELNAAIADATFVIAPSEIGLLAVDALRVGTPVLFPDQPRNGPEIESLTENVNAMKFAHGDVSAIVTAIERWLSHADTITEHEFVTRRSSSLQTWSPGNVADRILHAIWRP